ncbi:MAG: DUF721 domain-containing protein [Methylohalobius sp.]|nr:DUF721 domain-containing protein [Methylohalobius sp.]
MANFKSLPVAATLQQDPDLSALLAQARWHAQLLDRIRSMLPQGLSDHCRYCLLRANGRLILYVDSAVWASKLRFYQSELKSALAELGPVESIQIRILPPAENTKKRTTAKIPSPQSLDLLARLAAASEDFEVRACLQRLICTLQRAAKRSPHGKMQSNPT